MQYRDVLRLQGFRNLWLGQAISQLGDAFYYVIFMFMVKKITGSTMMVGVVGAIETVPYLLLSLYAGVVADRIDRRRIMLSSDLVCGTVLVLFAVLVFVTGGKPPVASMLVVPGLLSLARVFFMPAKNAAIPALTPPELVGQANALSSTSQNFMPMIALSLSATVLAVVYAKSPVLFFGITVLVNAFSYLASAWFVSRLPHLIPDRDLATEKHPWVDLKDGIRYVRSSHALALQICLNGAFALFVSPFFVVYVAANDQWFGGKPQSLAWFECSFFVALVLCSLLVGKLNVRRVGLGFIGGIGAVGFFVLAMGFSPHFWSFLFWNFACGLTIPFADIPLTTWKALTVPDTYRGRVNSFQTLVQTGSQPIGMSLGGIFVDRFGLVAVFAVMGVGMVVTCLAGLFDREFRCLTLPHVETAGVALAE